MCCPYNIWMRSTRSNSFQSVDNRLSDCFRTTDHEQTHRAQFKERWGLNASVSALQEERKKQQELAQHHLQAHKQQMKAVRPRINIAELKLQARTPSAGLVRGARPLPLELGSVCLETVPLTSTWLGWGFDRRQLSAVVTSRSHLTAGHTHLIL
jgi:hypothetical protein